MSSVFSPFVFCAKLNLECHASEKKLQLIISLKLYLVKFVSHLSLLSYVPSVNCNRMGIEK